MDEKHSIHEIFERVQRLEEVVFGPEKAAKKRKSKGNKKRVRPQDLKTPTKQLAEQGFFEEARTDVEVADELQRRLLTSRKPARASVVNAVQSLVRGGFLERIDVQRGKRNVIGYRKRK